MYITIFLNEQNKMPKSHVYSKLSPSDKRKYNKKMLLLASSVMKNVKDNDLELEDLLKHKAFKAFPTSVKEAVTMKEAVQTIVEYAADQLFANSVVSKFNDLTGERYERKPDEKWYDTVDNIDQAQDRVIENERRRRNMNEDEEKLFNGRAIINKQNVMRRQDPTYRPFAQVSDNHVPIKYNGSMVGQRNIETSEVVLNPDLAQLLEDIKLGDLDEE